MNKLKIFVTIIAFVWMIGAVISGLGYELERKKSCVENEGWIKGIMWCNTDPKTPLGQSSHIMGNMIKGLGWPFRLLDANKEKNTAAPIIKPNGTISVKELTKEMFDQSRVGVAYVCYLTAIKLEKSDSTVLAKGISFFRRKFQDINDQHDEYMAFASTYLYDFNQRGKLGKYYSSSCVTPVKTMSKMLDDGML